MYISLYTLTTFIINNRSLIKLTNEETIFPRKIHEKKLKSSQTIEKTFEVLFRFIPISQSVVEIQGNKVFHNI